MKLFRTACLCSLAALALASCGGSSFCDDDATAMSNLSKTKLANCPTLAASVSATSLPSGQACTDALAKCSSDDQTKLTSSVTCLNNLANCPSDTDATWLGSLIACSTTGVCATSAACQTAFGMTATCAAIPH